MNKAMTEIFTLNSKISVKKKNVFDYNVYDKVTFLNVISFKITANP